MGASIRDAYGENDAEKSPEAHLTVDSQNLSAGDVWGKTEITYIKLR